MKKMLVVFALLVSYSGFSQFYGGIKENKMTVSGDAILRVVPDQVVFNLGVILKGEDLLEIKNDNYKRMEKVINYCKDRGIPQNHIQTDQIYISPSYHSHNNYEIEYYTVSQSISIVLENLDIYDQLLTSLLGMGINKVNHVEFRAKDIKDYRYQVRKMAIEAAKEKAEFLSQEVGIKIGDIINIGESVQNPSNSFGRHNYANYSQNVAQLGGGQNGDSLSVGMLSFKASVTLVYDILDD